MTVTCGSLAEGSAGGGGGVRDKSPVVVVADGRSKQSGSGSDPFRTGSQNLFDSGPRTGPSVRFIPCPEPWTEPRSGSAGFRFEPRF
jgi:hypothetical protein